MDTVDGGFWTTCGYDVNDLPGRWQQMLSATHLPWAVRLGEQAPGHPFEAWIRRWRVDDLALVDCECGPCSGTRQGRQVAETSGEYVIVLINRAGCETVSQGGADAHLRPGDAVVWDSVRPARFAVWEPLRKRSLLIPRAALDEVAPRSQITADVTLHGDVPAVRLLVSYLRSLSLTLPQLSPPAVAAARNAALELFAAAARPDSGTPGAASVRVALRSAMDRYIERHLPDRAVTPLAIAHAHGVSVRTVNRVYNATGQTVGEVIMARRLARAREDLTRTADPISSIAHRWGFADSGHFSRSFKARYGQAPRDYRDSARCAGGSGSTGGCGTGGDGAPGQDLVALVQARAVARPEDGITSARG